MATLRGCSLVFVALFSIGWSIPIQTFNVDLPRMRSQFKNCPPSGSTFRIPNGTTSIAVDEFRGCHSPFSVIIPASVTSIGDTAFSYCGLTSIEIPDTVKSIGRDCFVGTDRLKTVTIGNGVTEIPSDLFYNVDTLTSVTLGKNVTSIGAKAFSGTPGLQSLVLPEKLKTISSYAFANIGNAHGVGLRSITIPDSVTSIGDEAFANCNHLHTINFGPASKLTSIGSNAFQYTALRTLSIPDSVVSTGHSICYRCSELVKLVIGERLKVVPASGFYENTKLSTIVWGKSVETIGKMAFWELGSVPITLPDTIVNISAVAFDGATGLSSDGTLRLPDSLKYIGWRAFEDTKLTSVSVPKDATLDKEAFDPDCKVHRRKSRLR